MRTAVRSSPQTSLEVTPTATTCTFENEKLRLSVRFLSPLLPEDPVLVSRPCTYIDFTVDRKREVSVKIDFTVTGDLVSIHRGKSSAEAMKMRRIISIMVL